MASRCALIEINASLDIRTHEGARRLFSSLPIVAVMRPYWAKADPAPLPVAAVLARQHGIDLQRYQHKSVTFARMEAGLIRLRHPVRAGQRTASDVATPGHA